MSDEYEVPLDVLSYTAINRVTSDVDQIQAIVRQELLRAFPKENEMIIQCEINGRRYRGTVYLMDGE